MIFIFSVFSKTRPIRGRTVFRTYIFRAVIGSASVCLYFVLTTAYTNKWNLENSCIWENLCSESGVIINNNPIPHPTPTPGKGNPKRNPPRYRYYNRQVDTINNSVKSTRVNFSQTPNESIKFMRIHFSRLWYSREHSVKWIDAEITLIYVIFVGNWSLFWSNCTRLIFFNTAVKSLKAKDSS